MAATAPEVSMAERMEDLRRALDDFALPAGAPKTAEAVTERLARLSAILGPLDAFRDDLFDARRALFVAGREEVDPKATHQALADASGISRPMVIKTLRAVGSA